MYSIPVRVERKSEYSILIDEGLLDVVGEHLQPYAESARTFVITELNVHRLYGMRLVDSLQRAGLQAAVVTLPTGETSKSLLIAADLYECLMERGARRRDTLVAVGGGMIMDLTGFVASTYLRGVPYANVPTSLVAQLDAGIGGKVGVNLPRGKNLIGAFYHPIAICIDPALVTTLPDADIRNGLSEAIKVAVIHSRPLFEFIETNCEALVQRNVGAIIPVIRQAVKAKLELLAPDPFEIDLRRGLNFGHTVGHVLEAATGYSKLCHGEAVSIGMCVATRVAASCGRCHPDVARRIVALLKRVGLPVFSSGINLKDVERGLDVIRAARGGQLNFVVPTEIGSCDILSDLPFDVIREHLGA